MRIISVGSVVQKVISRYFLSRAWVVFFISAAMPFVKYKEDIMKYMYIFEIFN